jgi:hypothetical protein
MDLKELTTVDERTGLTGRISNIMPKAWIPTRALLPPRDDGNYFHDLDYKALLFPRGTPNFN